MSECDYPLCHEAARGSTGIHVQPELIGVELCDEHRAIVRTNTPTPETAGFWRWFAAMTQFEGAG